MSKAFVAMAVLLPVFLAAYREAGGTDEARFLTLLAGKLKGPACLK